MKASGYLLRCLVLFLSLLLVFPVGTLNAAAAKAEIKHDQPGDNYIPGFRINLDAIVKDSAGILTARCYFKTKADKNFGFVKMTNSGDNDFKAVLPAPFVGSEEVHYLFVSVNKAKKVTRTEMFILEEAETKEGIKWKDISEVKEVRLDQIQDTAEKFALLYDKSKGAYAKNIADYQTTSAEGVVQVGTELPTSEVPLKGFYDKASVKEVPAAAKYGLAAEGLYAADALARAGGVEASGASSAGTIAAGSGSSKITGGLIGIAVVGGGIALASGSSGSSSGSSGAAPGGSPGGGLTTADLVGTWDITGLTSQWHSRTPYTLLSNGTWSGQASAQPIFQNVNGTWSFNESAQTLTLSESSAGYSATIPGNAISGTASSFTVSGNLPAIPYTNNSGQSFTSGQQDTFRFIKQ